MRTRRAILRPITLDDAAAWKSCNNAIRQRMPSWPRVPSVVYARNEILHYIGMRERGERYVYAILERGSGELIGDFHLKSVDRRRRRVEFGHSLHPRVWGGGITYETLDAIRRACSRIGYTPWAKVDEENVRSWRSLERYAARYCGAHQERVGGHSVRMRVYELPRTNRGAAHELSVQKRPTAFAQRVYDTLLRVPRGRVTTYKDLATAAGTRSYRAVGQALRCNPYAPRVPCHRVIASDGTLGGFNGETKGAALDRKRKLLESEGIRIADRRVVDFERSKHKF
jgi:methylated-DNA-[protein]-cysteine S-methyltransferase